MYSDNGHMNGAWGFAMMLVMLGFFALIALGIFWFARSNHAPTSPPAPTTSNTAPAERILAERMARGEIDQTEYESRLRTLTG